MHAKIDIFKTPSVVFRITGRVWPTISFFLLNIYYIFHFTFIASWKVFVQFIAFYFDLEFYFMNQAKQTWARGLIASSH